jgi:hypothetical protein
MAADPEARRVRLWQPGTLPRAAIMAGFLGLGLLFITWVWPAGSPVTDIDRYLRRGPVAGAESLRLDLVRLSPPGADTGPAVQHLISLGFACAAPALPSGQWVCVQRRPAERRAIRHIEAQLRLDQGSAAAITTRIWDEAPR